mmetsp:Transcript_4440/g.13019  ORF Transcript_4440/g.13019 Transcript_4440/m.13019 type:complete len:86 (+) Transcript_4440:84-341(+)
MPRAAWMRDVHVDAMASAPDGMITPRISFARSCIYDLAASADGCVRVSTVGSAPAECCLHASAERCARTAHETTIIALTVWLMTP